MNVNILIGTPAYNGMVHIDYMNSILEMTQAGIPLTVMSLGNESLISRGRNTIISYFHELKDFTHLLFLDADIGIKAESIIRLLNHEKDVIAAPVPLKGYNEKGEKVYNITKLLEQEYLTELYKVEHVGTAVFMLSRKAVESLVDNAIAENDIYNSNPLTRGENSNLKMYDIFKTGVDKSTGIYLSEDFYVCNTLKKLGYNIYVDDKIMVTHNGMFTF